MKGVGQNNVFLDTNLQTKYYFPLQLWGDPSFYSVVAPEYR